MTVTYNKKEAINEISKKELKEKTVIPQNNNKIKRYKIISYINYIVATIIILLRTTILFSSDELLLFSNGFNTFRFLLYLVGISVFVMIVIMISLKLGKLQKKMIDMNNKILKLSPNAQYHRLHQNKTLIKSSIKSDYLEVVFQDDAGETYIHNINISDFEAVESENLKNKEINLYEKKIYEPTIKQVRRRNSNSIVVKIIDYK